MSVFERILAGEIPCKKVYEDACVLAFHDLHPQAPVHVLVIPKRKLLNTEELFQQSPDYIGQFFLGIHRVLLHLGLPANGYRLVFNCGEEGGQTVPYLHAHLLGGKQLIGFA
jgi:histidine triad (HIT) family protein